MKYRLITLAGVLAISAALSGCSGSNVTRVESTPESSEAVTSSTVNTTKPKSDSESVPVQDDTSTVVSVESSGAELPPASAEETEEEILGTLTIESPTANVDYPADWLYGTWSAFTLNGNDYWEFADQQGIDGEVQMIFGSDGGRFTRGSEGVIMEFTYKVTDSGVILTDKESNDVIELTYDPAADALTMLDDDLTAVFIRGGNPRESGTEIPVGEGVYGLWSVSTLNGEDYWESDAFAEIVGESFLEINESGLRTINNYETTDYCEVRLTDTGAEFTDTRYDEEYVLTYDEASDTLICFLKSEPQGDIMVMKRGSNPKPGTQNDCGWIYGTWSAVTVNGQDFWTFAQEEDIDYEWQLVFSTDTCFAIGDDTAKCGYSVDGDIVTVLSGVSTTQTAMYNSSTDMLMLNDEQAGQTIVMKRGTNPRS